MDERIQTACVFINPYTHVRTHTHTMMDAMNTHTTPSNRTGTLAPPLNSIHRFDSNGHPIYLPPWMSDWLNLNVVVPTIAMIVIIVGVLVICIAITRRRIDMRNGPKDVYCRFTDGYLPRV